MKYVSTRGQAPVLGFEDVLLSGLANDGGLYVPAEYPRFSLAEIKDMRSLSYPELAAKVLKPYIGDTLTEDELKAVTEKAYSRFSHQSVAPLHQLDNDLWVMELFYGPTLAFKDYALQMLGLLFDAVLSKRNRRITIVGATSGDTGSAAIEACRNKKTVDIFILHPHNRVSEIQRRQMTTVLANNVFNIALEGDFDDCQRIVKELFADKDFRESYCLSAVNSINWARIAAQTVYYFWAGLRLGAPDREVSFAVPTGNFGNVFAGYVAKQMGLPIKKLFIGSNANDILPRFFETGEMRKETVVPSISPSMDIQVSSNFERLLFEMTGRKSEFVERAMEDFTNKGFYKVPVEVLQKMGSLFSAYRCDDAQTKDVLKQVYKETGMVQDPHSAIGIAVGRHFSEKGVPTICLATAHPSKFPNAVREATGVTPALPEKLADLRASREKMVVLPNKSEDIRYFIENSVERKG